MARDATEGSELLARAAIDAVLIVDPHGRVAVANDVAAELLRTTPAALVGCDTDTLVSPSLTELRRALPDDTSPSARVAGIFKVPGDGEIPVEVWVRDIGAGRTALILRDVTELAAAQSTLGLVTAGVENAVDSFEITDGEGRIEYANAAHAVITGYPLFEALGTNIAAFVDDVESADAIRAALASGHSWQGEVTCTRKDGAVRFHELSLAPVTDGRSRLQRFVAVRRDVTRRVLLEREADLLRQELARADRRSAVGQLAARVAHEVNNPATFILTNLAMVAEELEAVTGALDSVSQEDLAARVEALRAMVVDAIDGTERVTQLVRDLRTYTKLEIDHREAVNPNDAIRDALKIAGVQARGRARITLELGDVGDVFLDRTRFSQVLVNLLLNAVQAIAPGREEENRITLRTSVHGSDVHIVVEDTGEGIAPEVLRQLFDAFFTTRPTGQGAGLGLAVTREIVEQAGGRVEVQSSVGQGSRFTIRLPVASTSSSALVR